jgi:hypothetical protein
VVVAERPEVRAQLSRFPPTSPELFPRVGDLAWECRRVDWPTIAERWHSLVFAWIPRPAPAGSVLTDLPHREPLELVRGRFHAHALTRLGCDHSAQPRGPLAGAFAFCLYGGSPGPAPRPRSTCAITRQGSRARTRSTSATTRQSRLPAAATRASPVR